MATPQNSGSKELSQQEEIFVEAIETFMNNSHSRDNFSDDDENYEQKGGDQSFKCINNLGLGQFIFLKDRPCKIVDKIKSKPGKHGKAKYLVVGVDVFTGKKIEVIFSSQERVSCPDVIREEYQVLHREDRYLELMSLETCEQWENFEVEDDEILSRIAGYTKDRNSTVLVHVLSIGREAKILSARLEH